MPQLMDRWLAWKAAQPPRPPFPDLHPTVEWQVCGRCNYDCSYCIQSHAYRTGAPEQHTVQAIIASLATLPGQWEIKMSGGEPFAFHGLIQWVIPGLVEQTRHLISILTNFSAPLPILERFCRLTADRLRITSASLHLEFTDPQLFLDKALAYRDLRARHNPHSSFVVNSVLVPGRLDQQRPLKDALEAHGLRYFPQLMKVKGGVYPYDDRDLALIHDLTGGSLNPREVNRAPSYRGLHCEAGAWYMTVDQNGDAWSCRTARRFAAASDDPADDASLGNLANGTFALRTKGGPCPYDICPCTVPANRGIVRLTNAQRANHPTLEADDGL